MLRLRQIAFAATDLAAAERALTSALGVQLCHRDKSVGVFGLHNALFPVGDQFLEIVSPVEAGTTAGRLLDKRGGDCGYMVLFQAESLGPVEQRIAEAGIRVVFDAAGPGIRGLHLHPRDISGAIVSIDAADDPADWPWAGADWRRHVATSSVRAIVGLDIAVADPKGVCAKWGQVLGVQPDGASLRVDDGVVRFVEGRDHPRQQGIAAITFAARDLSLLGSSQDLLGVSLRFVAA